MKPLLEKQIPLKEIPPKMGGPLKNRDIIEDKNQIWVSTHAGIFYSRWATDQLSNGEREVSFKKF